MGSSAMGDELQIENYLLARLKEALEELATTEKYLPAKLAKLPPLFNQLKDSLEGPNQTPKPREKLYKLNNLLSEWQVHSKKKKRTRYSVQSLRFVYDYKKDLEKMKEELDLSDGVSILQTSNNGVPILRGEEIQDYRWSNRVVDVEQVYELHDRGLSLQQFLVVPRGKESDDRRFSMIGVVGVRGVGKTTLAQVLFANSEVKKHFLPRIWVCLSKQPKDDFDPRVEMVKRMLMCLGLEEEIIATAKKNELKGLLFALRQQLMGKRYLIVLDDVWCKEEKYKEFSTFCSSLQEDHENKCSEKLAYGLPKGYGGAVIVTGRIEELVMGMVGEENLHTVKLLREIESCWKIFKDFAGKIEEVPEDEKAKTVENTACANGHVEEQEENFIGENYAFANGYVEMEEEDLVLFDAQVNPKGLAKEDSDKQEEDLDPFEEKFQEIKEKIIQKCCGLPLAARMLGEIARESDLIKPTRVPESTPQSEQQQVAENLAVPKSTPQKEQQEVAENLGVPESTPQKEQQEVAENLGVPESTPRKEQQEVAENLGVPESTPRKEQQEVAENLGVPESTPQKEQPEVAKDLRVPGSTPKREQLEVAENLGVPKSTPQREQQVLENREVPAGTPHKEQQEVAENQGIPESTPQREQQEVAENLGVPESTQRARQQVAENHGPGVPESAQSDEQYHQEILGDGEV